MHDIFVIMKSNISTKSLRFGRVSRGQLMFLSVCFVNLFRMCIWMSFDGLQLVIDGFSEMFLVLHLILIVVTRDWGVLFAGRGEGVDPACA